MVKNFSSVFIKNLKYAGCQVYHLDKVKFSSPGQLGIRIGKATRSWFVQCRIGGKLRKQNIAVYPTVGLAEARTLASAKLEEMKSSPEPKQRAAITEPTVTDLWEAYQEVLDPALNCRTPCLSVMIPTTRRISCKGIVIPESLKSERFS